MLDNMNDYDLDPELCECARLISNTFTINSAGISPSTRRRRQSNRGVQRRLNIKCDSPEKDNSMTEEDISFYSTNNLASSPRPCPISPCHTENLLSPGTSPSIFMVENNVQLQRLNSYDSTSMDSGYSSHRQESNNRLSQSSTSSSVFQFLEPKRPETVSPTTIKTPLKYSSGSKSSSMNSSENTRIGFTDEDYLELMDMESMEADIQLPTDLSSLICKDIKTPDSKRSNSLARKCLNMNSITKKKAFSPSTPKSSNITSLITTPERQCLQNISENVTPFCHRHISSGAFKRPEPPAMSPINSKRYKSENDPPASADCMKHLVPPQFPQERPILRKSVSMNDASIMSALSRSSSEPNLIGDFSRPFCLPIIEGRHTDLKSISTGTMRKLILGEFDDSRASFKVIDCRYPYEFEGGHIIGALNLYTHEQIIEELLNKKTEPAVDGIKRSILVFHCEFSSERGPKLSRFLRERDRSMNLYPSLQYPEIYLLHGGYKEFFESNADLCDPIAYRPMLEPAFTNEYKLFRAKTKSWTNFGDIRASANNRSTKSRSRLVL